MPPSNADLGFTAMLRGWLAAAGGGSLGPALRAFAANSIAGQAERKIAGLPTLQGGYTIEGVTTTPAATPAPTLPTWMHG